ncbi:MAG: ferrochelatase [Acidimicrobiales bacterium]
MSEAKRFGLIVMAYGTPRTPAEIEPYYTHIRRGRAPEPQQLADLVGRYEAIGGISPLAERTEAQRLGLEKALSERMPDSWMVVLGQKHAAPFIEDAVEELAAAGITEAVGIVLAPHYSGFSVGEYQRRAIEAGEQHGVTVHAIERWFAEDAYLGFLTDAVRDARATLPENHIVLFTAHSLPERVLEGDPYPDELLASATHVAQSLALPNWALCWQSAGRTPEPWRGPDVLDEIRRLAAEGSVEGVLVCAQGFTADHLEVLYDLDIETLALANELGLAFARTRSMNDNALVINALADLVVNQVQ